MSVPKKLLRKKTLPSVCTDRIRVHSALKNCLPMERSSPQVGEGPRRDICHKHHKQRLCKIISTGVKFLALNMLLEHLMLISFWFW